MQHASLHHHRPKLESVHPVLTSIENHRKQPGEDATDRLLVDAIARELLLTFGLGPRTDWAEIDKHLLGIVSMARAAQRGSTAGVNRRHATVHPPDDATVARCGKLPRGRGARLRP